METHFTGTIWKLGDDIDTDIIMPTQWLTMDSMDDIKTVSYTHLDVYKRQQKYLEKLNDIYKKFPTSALLAMSHERLI